MPRRHSGAAVSTRQKGGGQRRTRPPRHRYDQCYRRADWDHDPGRSMQRRRLLDRSVDEVLYDAAIGAWMSRHSGSSSSKSSPQTSKGTSHGTTKGGSKPTGGKGSKGGKSK
jgi:hypothetical protein